VSEPETQAADVGDDVTLTCHVEGNPRPTVSWRRHGDQRVLGRQSSLRLSRVTADQFTTYTCSASSAGHRTVSRDVHLLRTGTPVIVSSSQQSARRGTKAVIECLVKAIPPPHSVTWTKNGQPVSVDAMPRYSPSRATKLSGLLSLRFLGAQPDISLHCQTTNTEANASRAFAGTHWIYPRRDGQAELT